MNTSFDRVSDGKDEWLTPKYITDFIQADLDPCSPGDRRPWDTAKIHLSLPIDGLTAEWHGLVFCNPPYGTETYKWLGKCADHGNTVALIFARTETNGFHTQVWDKATSLFFFKGRLSFHHVSGKQGDSAGAPSVLIAYGSIADDRIQAFSKQYDGRYIRLEHEPKPQLELF